MSFGDEYSDASVSATKGSHSQAHNEVSADSPSALGDTWSRELIPTQSAHVAV